MTTPKRDDRSTLVDPRVSAAWRAASSDEPPASIDAAILAAARREVAAGPEPIDTRAARADRRRWLPLAAAATIAAVVVGVLQMTPTDKLGAPVTDTTFVSDVPAPATPKPAPEGATSALSAKEDKPARSDDAGARSENRPVDAQRTPESSAAPAAPPPPAPFVAPPAASAPRPVVPPAGSSVAPATAPTAAPTEPRQQVAPAPPPVATPDPFPAAKKTAADTAAASGQLAASPPAAPPRSEAAANVSRERASIPPPDSPPASASAPAASRVMERAAPATPPSAPLGKMAAGRAADSEIDEARAKERTPLPVPEWIALIRRLRVEGKQAEAAKELTAFRAAHADHEKLLPPDLRDWREK